MRFRDRPSAGRKIGEEIVTLELVAPVVIALPRGGVPVAAEVARTLGAPLDVLVVRKIGAPDQPEFGIGAIAEGGVLIFDDDAVRALRIRRGKLDELRVAEERELDRRVQQYRRGRAMIDVKGRDVVVVDDGLATGVTATAAIQALRERHPRRLFLAVPVGASDTVARMAPLVDGVVCLFQPPEFRAVGLYYDHFDQTTDAEVEALLGAANGA